MGKCYLMFIEISTRNIRVLTKQNAAVSKSQY